MVIQTTRIPSPGETVLGGTFFMNPGGKGANQAVAAARLGGNVTFICKTGNDVFGRQSKELFSKEHIDTSFVLSDADHPSGIALITVDKNGENTIVVATGSNDYLLPQDLKRAESRIRNAAFVLVQLEIPLQTVEYIADLTAGSQAKLILNPAPARDLPDELLKQVYALTPNEIEAEYLTGVKVKDRHTAEQAATTLYARGVQTTVLTRGADGALLFVNGKISDIPTVAIQAIDTTAAGDVFNGALAVALAEGKNLEEASHFACRVAALSVTRLGAQSAIPYRSELKF